MPVDKTTQHLHTISAQLSGIDTRLGKVEADLDVIKRSVGESHAFIKPDKGEVEDPKGKGKDEAKPPTLKQLYHKGKASLKRRGLTQAMYQHMVKALKGRKLQGDEYKQVYIDCYNANGYGSL